jgi:hypothetical protein
VTDGGKYVLLLMLGYLINFIIYSVAVYAGLLAMERIGGKYFGTWRQRLVLAGACAIGAIMLQLAVHVTSLAYTSIYP